MSHFASTSFRSRTFAPTASYSPSEYNAVISFSTIISVSSIAKNFLTIDGTIEIRGSFASRSVPIIITLTDADN